MVEYIVFVSIPHRLLSSHTVLLVLQAKAIITKYLSADGNKLGSAELNAIGGPNLCSLDVDVLRNISQQSLK